jgi:hypothetical protein
LAIGGNFLQARALQGLWGSDGLSVHVRWAGED